MSLTFLLLFTISAYFQTSHSPLDDFLSTDFDVITRTRTFPVGVNTEQVMASPGESYNMTDVGFIEDPYQRLIFAGKSDSLWFLYYEQGGMQYETILLLFKPITNGFETLWVGHLLYPHKKNLKELKEVIMQSRLFPDSKDQGGFIESENVIVERPISRYKVLFGKSRERPSDFNFFLNFLCNFEVNTFNNTLKERDTTISFQFTSPQMDSIYEQMVNMDIVSYPSDFQPSDWETTSSKFDSVVLSHTFTCRANNATKQIKWTRGILSSQHKAIMLCRFFLLIKRIAESSPQYKQLKKGSKK